MPRKNQVSIKSIALSFIVTASLLVLMAFAFSACQVVPSDTEQLPRLLALIQDPAHWGSPQEILIHPNGLAYVVLVTGGIAVLDGPELVTVIPRPALGQQMERMYSHLALHPDTEQVYWTDHEGYVHVISGTEVITSIPDVKHIPNAITIHPDSGLVYVANAKRRGWPEHQTLPSNVTVISGTQIVTDLIVGYVPSQLVVHPIDKRIYVAQNTGWSYRGQQVIGMLGIIEDMKVVTNTSLGIGQETDAIEDIAIHPNDGSLYLHWRHALLYWDRENPPIKVPIDYKWYGPGFMRDIAVDARHNLVYASRTGSTHSGVSVIHDRDVITEILIPGEPREMAVDETHGYVYVANYRRGEMSVIRGTEMITTLPTGGWGTWDIGVDEKWGYIYVSNADSHSIAVFGFDNSSVDAPALADFLQRRENQ